MAELLTRGPQYRWRDLLEHRRTRSWSAESSDLLRSLTVGEATRWDVLGGDASATSTSRRSARRPI